MRPDTSTRVFVVDDDEAIARMMEVLLRRHFGAEVTVVRSAYGLLNLIAAQRPALVVLDVMLPGLDGPSVTELVRRDVELRGTRIVLHSAQDEATLAQTTQTCGADGYLPKGLRIAEVIKRLKTFLDHADVPGT